MVTIRQVEEEESGDEYLVPEDLQDRLGVGRSKAYEICHQPDFPAVRPTGKENGKIRIPEDLFEDWLEKKAYDEEL